MPLTLITLVQYPLSITAEILHFIQVGMFIKNFIGIIKSKQEATVLTKEEKLMLICLRPYKEYKDLTKISSLCTYKC